MGPLLIDLCIVGDNCWKSSLAFTTGLAVKSDHLHEQMGISNDVFTGRFLLPSRAVRIPGDGAGNNLECKLLEFEASSGAKRSFLGSKCLLNNSGGKKGPVFLLTSHLNCCR